MNPTGVLVVAAGNRREAAEWAASNFIDPRRMVIATGFPGWTHGLIAAKCVLVGKFWRRSDAVRAYETLKVICAMRNADLVDLTRDDSRS